MSQIISQFTNSYHRSEFLVLSLRSWILCLRFLVLILSTGFKRLRSQTWVTCDRSWIPVQLLTITMWQKLFIKCGRYYKVWQALQSVARSYYKGWQLLESVTRSYYREWQVLQSLMVIIKWNTSTFRVLSIIVGTVI